MNRSMMSTPLLALAVSLGLALSAGCGADTDDAPQDTSSDADAGDASQGTPSESTVCRQGGSDLCNIGCVPSAELIELGTDCCACKPLICDGVTCAAPQCGLGETVSLPAESCCPACVPETTSCSNDTDFICSAFTCAEGYVPVETEDECCGHCTGDETFCEDEAAAYLTQLQAWLTPDVTACTEDTDCVHLPASNQCKASCFGSAINSAFAEELSATINDYAEANCSRCPWISVTCPAIEMIPTCNQGTCQ